jgi:hypothetical protein
VIPRLPGEWLVTGYALVQALVEHLACAVIRDPSSFGPSYRLRVMIQPLYVEMDGWQGRSTIQLGRGHGQGLWPGFDSVAEGAESMRRMAELVESDALPYFAAHGTLQDFRELCRDTAAAHPSFGKVYPLRQQAATEVLLDEYAAAIGTLTEIRTIADTTRDAPDWLKAIADEADAFRTLVATDPAAARTALSEVEDWMRARLQLPGVTAGG